MINIKEYYITSTNTDNDTILKVFSILNEMGEDTVENLPIWTKQGLTYLDSTKLLYFYRSSVEPTQITDKSEPKKLWSVSLMWPNDALFEIKFEDFKKLSRKQKLERLLK